MNWDLRYSDYENRFKLNFVSAQTLESMRTIQQRAKSDQKSLTLHFDI